MLQAGETRLESRERADNVLQAGKTRLESRERADNVPQPDETLLQRHKYHFHIKQQLLLYSKGTYQGGST